MTVKGAGGGSAGVPDHKLLAREKKIFDANGKAKERFKLLVALEDDGFQQRDVSSVYARRANDIVALIKAQLDGFALAHTARNKQYTVEHILPVLEVIRQLTIAVADQVRAGWNGDFFLRELETALHVDVHPTIRRTAMDVLLSFVDVLGKEVQHAHVSLLLSVFDWNAVKHLSEPQQGLYLPRGVRVLRTHRRDFYPKKPDAAATPSEAQRLLLEPFQDLWDYVAKQTHQLPLWWSLVKGALTPILYPQFADGAGVAEGVTGGFRGLSYKVHSIVVNALLSLLQQERSARVLLATLPDVKFVLDVLGYSFSVLPLEELTALYRLARMYYSWLAETPPTPLISQHLDKIIPQMTESLASVFKFSRADMQCRANDTAVQVKFALYEVVSEFFVQVQQCRKVAVVVIPPPPPSAASSDPPSVSGGGTGGGAPSSGSTASVGGGGAGPTGASSSFSSSSAAAAASAAAGALPAAAAAAAAAAATPPPPPEPAVLPPRKERYLPDALRTSTLNLYLNRAVVPVFRGLGSGVSIYEAASELVSRSFYAQWVLSQPSREDCAMVCTSLTSLIASTSGQRAHGYGVCIPHTSCSGTEYTFSPNPLLGHWRIIVTGLLRIMLSISADAELPAPYDSLVLPANLAEEFARAADLPSFLTSEEDRDVATAGMSGEHLLDGLHNGLPEAAAAEAKKVLQKSASVLSIHQQRPKPLESYTVAVLVKNYADINECAGVWVNLVGSMTKAVWQCWQKEQQHDSVYLCLAHTLADIVSDVMHSHHMHRTLRPVAAPTAAEAAAAAAADTAAANEGGCKKTVRHLLCTLPGPLPLRTAHVTTSALSDLVLPSLLHSTDITSSPFKVSGGPAMTVSAICDLLAMGTTFTPSFLSVTLPPVCRALSGVDVPAMKAALYHLFPVGGHTGAASQACTAVPHVFSTWDPEVSRRVLPPLTLAACAVYGLPQAASSGGCAADREARVRCSAAAVLTWAAAVCHTERGRPTEFLEGSAPAGCVAALTGERAPESYEALGHLVLAALGRACGLRQPWEARLRAVKGLGLVGRMAQSPEAARGVVGSLRARLLDADPAVAREAVSAVRDVVENKPEVADLAAGVLATALLCALQTYPSYTHPSLLLALVAALHSQCVSHPLGPASRALLVETLLYAAAGRTRHAWVLPSLAVLSQEPATDGGPAVARPVVDAEDGAAAAAVAAGSSIVVDGRAGPAVWWGSGGVEPKEVRDAAELSLQHAALFCGNFPLDGRDPTRASTAAAAGVLPPPRRCGGGGSPGVSVMCGDSSVVTMGPGAAGALRMTSRTMTGRQCWEARPVRGAETSMFAAARGVTLQGHARSMSGAVVGRVRTHALHEATPTLCSILPTNTRLGEEAARHTPAYLSGAGDGGDGDGDATPPAAAAWELALQKEGCAVDALLADAHECDECEAVSVDDEAVAEVESVPAVSPTTVAVTQAEEDENDVPAWDEGEGGDPASVIRGFLATGLLYCWGPTVPFAEQGAAAAAAPLALPRDGGTWRKGAQVLDGMPERDTQYSSLLYLQAHQTTLAEVLWIAHDC